MGWVRGSKDVRAGEISGKRLTGKRPAAGQDKQLVSSRRLGAGDGPRRRVDDERRRKEKREERGKLAMVDLKYVETKHQRAGPELPPRQIV